MLRWGLALAVVGALALGAVVIASPGKDDAGTEAGGGTARLYTLPGDAVFPEGVAFDPRTGFFYVSSTTDGTIFRGKLGDRVLTPFLQGGRDGRSTAVGLELDGRGRLFIAGGATGRIWAYDTKTKKLLRRFETGQGGFINDLAAAGSGHVYVTDSFRPSLYRIAPLVATSRGPRTVSLGPYVRLGAAVEYADGFNVNGIAASDGAVTFVHSRTGKLFRLVTASKKVEQVDTGDERFENGDGLVLAGRTLYVVRNRQEEIVELRLAGDGRSGEVVGQTTDASFRYPTTAALARGRLLVVNSQFNRQSSTPELPFTVSSIPAP